ncbi:M16 family metallopeptidase [Novosphingobium sp. SG707]|uniref:M16 family metallopeptidase n=1 Tax=Novosphingobium sp. SG707 TaxID=2586996 RepID=UPI001445B2DA|nr:M16 family metallopeptidase [Novosphingobium sp. SG707]NKJ00558.1 zinc protease [Novosphingobium sp. SG707]
MSHFSRAPRLLSLVISLALIGAQTSSARTASVLPPLPSQDAPWLYKGSDVPHDREWYFGVLDNGVRWAVRNNQVPPGQVSIRVRVDVGAMHEKPQEAGFAHLIEHLVFRQSRYLPQGAAIPTWQRLGATFGSDTNAETTPTATTYKIDLPDASPATLDESMKLISGMVFAPNLSDNDIRIEAPIVLAEKRERGGTAERLMIAMRKLMAEGQPLASHVTVGDVETINGARQNALRAFHQRWYRPEKVTVVVAGDADPRLTAALVTKWFGEWKASGPATPDPDFGEPTTPAGADPANPVGAAQVLIEPTVPRSLIYAVLRPWHEKQDTVVYNQGLMLDQLALAILNRRLEARARSGGNFLSARVDQENESRSVDGTFVTVSPLDGNWRGALSEVRGIIADMLDRPPSVEDIAREAAEMNVVFESQVQQRALLPGGKLADDLVQAVDIHETVASPAVVQDIFKQSMPLFTPQAVQQHARSLFAGRVIRSLYVTPDKSEVSPQDLRAALLTKAVPDERARAAQKPISFAQLPAIGAPSAPPEVRPTGMLDVQELTFANGVKAQFWPTKDDPGRVIVKVRFGAGWQAFKPTDNAYATLGQLALVSSGEGPLGQEELDRISTGRKLGFDFRIDDGSFQFTGETRAEDLEDQLYLFAAKFAMPRWDSGPLLRARAAGKIQFSSYAASPQGVMERDLRYLQRGNDERFAVPTPEQLDKVTPEGFRQVWAPILAQGPIEVQVFGDFDSAKGMEALQKTFGALAPRGPLQPATTKGYAFARPGAQPVVVTHEGDANQAAAVVTWPTGGGVEGLSESRHLEVLSQVFANRLLAAMREKSGASYAPQVSADWPIDLPGGGTLSASAQVTPQMVPLFFETVDRIAADLATRKIPASELALVTEPLRQQVARASSSTAFFMSQIEGATQDPRRYAQVRGLMADYVNVKPEELQALAARWLIKDRAFRLAIVPERK